MKQSKMLLRGAALSCSLYAGYLGYLSYQHQTRPIYSLPNILPMYAFEAGPKQDALQLLLQKFSIIQPEENLVKAFPPRVDNSIVLHDLVYLLDETQNKFVKREGKKERWEVEANPILTEHKDEMLQALKTLGFVEAIHPKKKDTDAICILGATMPSMQNRLKFANTVLNEECKSKMIILLSGERYVTKDVDASIEKLKEIAAHYHLQDWQRLTETQLLDYEYHKSALHSHNLPKHVIHTNRIGDVRPTTETTVLQLLEWIKLEHPEIKHVTFVSNQPYVLYQQAVIGAVLRSQNSSVMFEVIGSATSGEKLQPIIGSVGSYIWAQTPLVINELEKNANIRIPDTLFRLYKNNPLLYQIVFASQEL